MFSSSCKNSVWFILREQIEIVCISKIETSFICETKTLKIINKIQMFLLLLFCVKITFTDNDNLIFK